ncbi:hypothetical protein ICN84_12055 [Akkermansia glycaniphila]|nr:hypothetical protein [Akkermansia glycaniphila]
MFYRLPASAAQARHVDTGSNGGYSHSPQQCTSRKPTATQVHCIPLPYNKEATESLPWLLQLTTYETQLFLLLKPHALSFMKLRNELIRIRRTIGRFRSKHSKQISLLFIFTDDQSIARLTPYFAQFIFS